MSNKLENPQAFPHGNPTDGGDIGMTLRDYFAGQALATISTIPTWEGRTAQEAYAIADAMMKERAK